MSDVDLKVNEAIDKDMQKKKIRKGKKQGVPESELQIKVNPWGFAFMSLAIAVIAYLAIGLIAALPPFEYNQLDEEYVINDALLVVLLILILIFLGLGIYFVWVKKTPEIQPTEVTTDETLQDEDDLTVLHIENDIASTDEDTKNEE